MILPVILARSHILLNFSRLSYAFEAFSYFINVKAAANIWKTAIMLTGQSDIDIVSLAQASLCLQDMFSESC